MKKIHLSQRLITALVAALVLLAVLFASLTIMQLLNPYKYSTVENGVEFLSDVQSPDAQLAALAEKRLFIVSPELYGQGTANSYMASSLVVFNAVLKANGRTAVSLARVLDEDGTLLFCQTNEGQALTNREISAEECEGWLADSEYVKVMVSMPDASLKMPRVIATKGSILIMPDSFQSVSSVSFRALEKMYPNSAEIIDEINRMLAGLQ